MELLINGLWVLSIALVVYGVFGILSTYLIMKKFKNSFEYQIISRAKENEVDQAEIKAYRKDIQKIIIAVLIIIVLLLS